MTRAQPNPRDVKARCFSWNLGSLGMAYEQAPLPSPRFIETYTNISGFHDPALPAFSEASSSQVACSISPLFLLSVFASVFLSCLWSRFVRCMTNLLTWRPQSRERMFNDNGNWDEAAFFLYTLIYPDLDVCFLLYRYTPSSSFGVVTTEDIFVHYHFDISRIFNINGIIYYIPQGLSVIRRSF